MLMNRRLTGIFFALICTQGCDGQTTSQVGTIGALAQSGYEKRADDLPLSQDEQAAIKLIKSFVPKGLRVDLPLAAVPALLIEAASAFQSSGGGSGGGGGSGTTEAPGTESPPTPCVGMTVVATGSGRTGLPTLPAESSSGDLAITDVQADGQSICGQGSPAAVVADFACGKITLTLTGTGFAVIKEKHEDNGKHAGEDNDKGKDGEHEDNGNGKHLGQDRTLSAEEIGPAYTVPTVPEFRSSTYLLEKARHVVLLDDSIALTPVPGAAQSDTRLVVQAPTQSVVDFMLAGDHTVTVVRPDKNWVRAPIRFGKPAIRTSLAPKITSARLIRTGDDPEDRDRFLVQITGKYLPVNPRLWYVKIGTTRTFAHAGFVGEASTIGFVHLPEGLTPGNQPITLITPFGLAVGNVAL